MGRTPHTWPWVEGTLLSQKARRGLPKCMTTYRLANGEPIYGEYDFVLQTDYFDDADTVEVVSETWVLLCSDTLILGGWMTWCSECEDETEELNTAPTGVHQRFCQACAGRITKVLVG